MLALELHGGARLAQEARDRVLVAERLVAQELDRDELVELDVPRGDDDAHPARAEHALDPVLAGEHVPRANGRGDEGRSLGQTSTKEAAARFRWSPSVQLWRIIPYPTDDRLFSASHREARRGRTRARAARSHPWSVLPWETDKRAR